MEMILLGIFAILFFSPLISFTRRINFINSTIIPAAHGYVVIKKNSYKNYLIKIKVINLTCTETMDKSKLSYVVWMELDHGKTDNLGHIFNSTVLFSNKLHVNLVSKSSCEPVKVFITVESSVNIQNPSSQVVLTTGNIQNKPKVVIGFINL